MNHSSTSISDFLAQFQEQFLIFIENTQQLGQKDPQGFESLAMGLLALSRSKIPPELLSAEEHQLICSWIDAMNAYDQSKMTQLSTFILHEYREEQKRLADEQRRTRSSP